MMIRTVFPLVVGSAAVFLGCGELVPKEDVLEAMALTGSEAGSAWTSAFDGDLGFQADLPCTGGGVVTMDSRWSLDEARNDLNIAFHDCQRGGVSIDGALEATVDGDVDVWNLSASAGVSLSGTLQYRGGIEGTCDLEVGATVDLVTWDPEVEWNGDVCGYNADEALDEAMDDLIESVSEVMVDLVLGDWW